MAFLIVGRVRPVSSAPRRGSGWAAPGSRAESLIPGTAGPALVRALEDPEPLVRGHAAWALGRIGTAEVRAALSARAEVESDAYVRAEIGLGPIG